MICNTAALRSPLYSAVESDSDRISLQGNMNDQHDAEESDALDALGSLANFAGCAP